MNSETNAEWVEEAERLNAGDNPDDAEDGPESSDPLEDAQEHAIQPDSFIDMAGAVYEPIIIKLVIRAHKHPRLYQWVASILNERADKKGRGSPLPRVLEAAMLFFMEWKFGLLEVRRKAGGGSGGGGDVAPIQAPVLFNPQYSPIHSEVQRLRPGVDLNQGRDQMRMLAREKTLEKSGMQTRRPVGLDPNASKTSSDPRPESPVDLSDGRLGRGVLQGNSGWKERDENPDTEPSNSFDDLVKQTTAF